MLAKVQIWVPGGALRGGPPAKWKRGKFFRGNCNDGKGEQNFSQFINDVKAKIERIKGNFARREYPLSFFGIGKVGGPCNRDCNN